MSHEILPTTFTIVRTRAGRACHRQLQFAGYSVTRNCSSGTADLSREQTISNLPCRPSDDRGRPSTVPPPSRSPRDLVRDDVVLSARTWVVKVGTSVLTGPDGTLDPARIDHLAEQISTVMDRGRKVALVSSGAVGAGMGQLGWKRRPDNLPQLQAAAAVGQAYLIRAYDEGLRRHRRHAAQLLLTHEDFDSRPRYLNMRNTLHALFECDAVPIINENDTISVDEIKFGDNDRLAAMVTNLLQAPLLVILSVVDGLYRTEPGTSTTPEPSPRWCPRSTTQSSAWPARARARSGPAACRASWRRPGR